MFKGDRIVLIDFGLSRQIDYKKGDNVLSHSGTDPFMSPEQRLGKINPKNDIFSLGVIIWFLISGDYLLDR